MYLKQVQGFRPNGDTGLLLEQALNLRGEGGTHTRAFTHADILQNGSNKGMSVLSGAEGPKGLDGQMLKWLGPVGEGFLEEVSTDRRGFGRGEDKREQLTRQGERECRRPFEGVTPARENRPQGWEKSEGLVCTGKYSRKPSLLSSCMVPGPSLSREAKMAAQITCLVQRQQDRSHGPAAQTGSQGRAARPPSGEAGGQAWPQRREIEPPVLHNGAKGDWSR